MLARNPNEDYSRGIKGHVRLWANMSALTEFLPQAIASFLDAHPDIRIEVEEQLSGEIVRALIEGLADIGVFAENTPTDGLNVTPFQTDELVVLYQQERGGAPPEPAPKRSNFKPYRPVVHQSLIFRPVIFVPVLIIAFVGLFLGYIYYQFTTFATLPKLEIIDPSSDGLAASPELPIG